MTTEQRPEVTQSTVRRLWDEALQTPDSWANVHVEAENLLERANAENPVVNWGLTDLHALTRTPDTSLDHVRQRHAICLAEMAEHDRDPALWMRRYFQKMLRDFTARHGPDRGHAFAAKLVRAGQLAADDLAGEALD